MCDSCLNMLEMSYADDLLKDWVGRSPIDQELQSLSYVILKCPSCHLYFQELVCDPHETLKIYSIRNYTAGCGNNQSRNLVQLAHMAEEAMLVRSLFPAHRPRVLDFGMGQGHWAAMAQAYDCEVWGTDINPGSQEIARARAISFCQIGDLPREYFDFINADQVLEHLVDPLEVLQQLASSLKPGSIIKISTPGDRRIDQKIHGAKQRKLSAADFRKSFDVLAPLYHLNLFAKESLLVLAQQFGLSPFRVPLSLSYSTMTLFNSLRQLNRNLYQPFKRWRSPGTWQFFKKN